jgi:hypothetical protein
VILDPLKDWRYRGADKSQRNRGNCFSLFLWLLSVPLYLSLLLLRIGYEGVVDRQMIEPGVEVGMGCTDGSGRLGVEVEGHAR